jgi:hypothetical protein
MDGPEGGGERETDPEGGRETKADPEGAAEGGGYLSLSPHRQQ